MAGSIYTASFSFRFPRIRSSLSITPKINDPVPVSWSGWVFTGIGAGLMGVLTYVRYRFVWWPVHPIGFATGTFYIMNWVWFSVFLAWFFKTIILKYGGFIAVPEVQAVFFRFDHRPDRSGRDVVDHRLLHREDRQRPRVFLSAASFTERGPWSFRGAKAP